MKLTVANYSSPDVENLWAWQPALKDVHALIEFEVGSPHGGSDIFSTIVATPEALRARSSERQLVISDRGTLIVSEFSWQGIREHIELTVSKCSAEDWASCTANLQRFFIGEYENYRP